MLDGVNIQDAVRTNSIDLLPNKLTIGQIAEMTIATSNVSPTIGGNATVISLSTPSGSNEFHGNGYWYNRNSFFGANDWFNNQSRTERPRLNLNQLGGSIGGPIKKDKLLFFVNYEAFRLKQQSLVTKTRFSRQQRGRAFSHLRMVLPTMCSRPAACQIDPYIQNLLGQIPTVGNTSSIGDQLNTTGYAFNARGKRDSRQRHRQAGLLPEHPAQLLCHLHLEP